MSDYKEAENPRKVFELPDFLGATAGMSEDQRKQVEADARRRLEASRKLRDEIGISGFWRMINKIRGL